MRSKTKKKNKNKRKVKVQGNKFIIWLEKHWLVEALLGYIFFIMVGIGVGYLTFGVEVDFSDDLFVTVILIL